MDISTALIEKIVGLITVIIKLKQPENKNIDLLIENVKDQIPRHIIGVRNWCTNFQFLGMAKPKNIQTDSIPLKFQVPRSYRSKQRSNDEMDEINFLLDNNNYLLLGDPGSGKTTTLKRLALNLFQEPKSSKDIYQYPILLIMRECNPELTFHQNLANALGIKYTVDDVDIHHHKIRQSYVGNTLLEIFLSDLINSTQPILFLDGLDEISHDLSTSYSREINKLARAIDSGKIILTCRSGYNLRTFEGFHIYEISPLNENQIADIAKYWLGDHNDFIDALKKLPFKDITDRPLLLTQLLFLFSREGSLPDQPSLIYRKTIRLLLQDWDSERDITRHSKYARFDPDVKSDFLSELSYHLTCENKTKSFTEPDLLKCYHQMYLSYGLPASASSEVVHEIETHTGIIINAGYNNYEFSHLSLQEYLCANYLVREAYSEHLSKYIKEYPAPVAITVALSSNPSIWFAGLILQPQILSAFTPESLNIFISRVLLEKPYLKPDKLLGCAVLELYFSFYEKTEKELQENIGQFLELPSVKESFRDALSYIYVIQPHRFKHESQLWIKKRFSLLNVRGCNTPSEGTFPTKVLKKVLSNSDQTYLWEDQKGNLCRFDSKYWPFDEQITT